MAIMKIIDRSTGKNFDILMDQGDYDKWKEYKYYTDKNTDKPFREEKVNNQYRRLFLAREIMGFQYKDKKVVNYKNGDIHDLRRNNLIDGVVGVHRIEGSFWPFTFRSLLNFLEKRKGIDEDLALLFLSKADKVKYSRKRIDIILSPDVYDEFQSKKVLLALKRVLHKYFEWGGQVTVVKDLKPLIISKKEKLPAPIAPLKPDTVPEKSEKLEKTFEVRENPDTNIKPVTTTSTKNNLIQLISTDKNASSDILEDSRIFPVEDLIKAIQKRMPMSIQFTSK